MRWNYGKGTRMVSRPSIQSKHFSLALRISQFLLNSQKTNYYRDWEYAYSHYRKRGAED